MSTGNSVEAQDNLQPGPSGSGTVLGSQPSTETGISQVANLTSGELQIKKKKKRALCVGYIHSRVLCRSFVFSVGCISQQASFQNLAQ